MATRITQQFPGLTRLLQRNTQQFPGLKLLLERPSIKLSVNQLINLHSCNIKIGPLTCEEWNKLLDNYFDTFEIEGDKWKFKMEFESLEDILLAGPPKKGGRFIDENRKSSMAKQFIGRFPSDAAETIGEAKGSNRDQIEDWADIFMKLKGESLRIQNPERWNEANLDLPKLIEKANKDLKEYSVIIEEK